MCIRPDFGRSDISKKPIQGKAKPPKEGSLQGRTHVLPAGAAKRPRAETSAGRRRPTQKSARQAPPCVQVFPIFLFLKCCFFRTTRSLTFRLSFNRWRFVMTERRVRFVLRRLGWLVPRAEVQMSDVNGPRGGIDKRCQVELRTDGAGSVVVASVASDWRTALDNALARAARFLLRLWRRGSDTRRVRQRFIDHER
jgi:hypothetical protein